MDDSVFNKLTKPIEYLDEVLHGLLLFQSAALLEVLPERSSLRQLQNDVEIVLGLVHIMKPDDVLTFEPLHNLNLRVECVLGVLILLDFGFGYNFDGDFLLGLFLDALENLRECTFSEFVVEVDNILAYPLLIAGRIHH